MMNKCWITVCMFYLTYFVSGQLSQTEPLRNITKCGFRAVINLACATGEVIAIHSLQYAYGVRCESTCCNYSSSDCLVESDGNDIKYLRGQCSGYTSCTINSLKERAEFCVLGVKDVSYVFLQYYCIPNTRISSICAGSKTLQSDGLPLYITNENYPAVTTSGSGVCSCSLEVFACSSNIDVYIIDADLFYDTSVCEQNIEFKNGTGTIMSTVGCEVYNRNSITTRNIGSHYSRIDFINNSTSNLEGQFFIGFKASETNVTFSLSCQSEAQAWCIDYCLGSNNCDPNAACQNTPEIYICTCNSGYTGNGNACFDIDECLGSNNCDPNAVCQNTPGSYTCTCTTGYTGNGSSCFDIDECLGSNNCGPNAVCQNTPGSYTCTCNTGFTRNKALCSDKDCTTQSAIIGVVLGLLNVIQLAGYATLLIRRYRASKDGSKGMKGSKSKGKGAVYVNESFHEGEAVAVENTSNAVRIIDSETEYSRLEENKRDDTTYDIIKAK